MEKLKKKNKPGELMPTAKITVAVRDIANSIVQITTCDSLVSLIDKLEILINRSNERINELKRQRIEAIDVEMAKLKEERDSLQ